VKNPIEKTKKNLLEDDIVKKKSNLKMISNKKIRIKRTGTKFGR
jgi:hypothetical protein